MTTRRLAAEIEYSKPVLYSHFKGKDAIMVAVAVEGFAERRPALYDAMFTHAVDLPFATAQAPAALQEAFGALCEAVRPLAGEDNAETLTETLWAGLHGLMTLMRSGRLRRPDHDRRLGLLCRFSG